MGILGTIKTASALAKANPAGFALSVLRVIWPYLLGAIVLAVLVWKIYGWGYGNAVEDEAKARGELVAQLAECRTQKQSALTANSNLAASELVLRREIAACTSENARLADEGLSAVQEAEAGRIAAESTLADWKRRGGSRAPTCIAAQAALVKACPAVKDF